MEMPPALSGVSKSRHDLITAKALQAQHAGCSAAQIELGVHAQIG
jgi:hypothetical protein